jgi:hypothetical protein
MPLASFGVFSTKSVDNIDNLPLALGRRNTTNPGGTSTVDFLGDFAALKIRLLSTAVLATAKDGGGNREISALWG